ncbi:MAG: hypothetical protein AAGJ86_10345 [Pseudomonadota bacterium]
MSEKNGSLAALNPALTFEPDGTSERVVPNEQDSDRSFILASNALAMKHSVLVN